MIEKKPILVLGAGSWGTALAMVLARNSFPTLLWDIDHGHIESMISNGSNMRHLPGIELPDMLTPIKDLEWNLQRVETLVVVVPCEALHPVMTELKKTGKSFRICLASKGLEPKTNKLNHLIVQEYLGDTETAILSGPSFAREVAAEIPTAVTIASENESTASFFADCFHNPVFRTYTHDDVIGVQVGGAVKNVMAIAAGIADGLNFGANTRAALITRGLAEITRLGVAMGGRRETFMGLTGLGDLVLTCTDDQSRNRRFGLALAAGKSVDEAKEEIGQAIEGIRTASALHSLVDEFSVEMPISMQIYDVINGKQTAHQAVKNLMSREPKSELA